MFLYCFYCLISFPQLAAFCQQFIKETLMLCYVMLCDSDTTFKIKRSKVNLQGAGAYCGGLPHSLFKLVKFIVSV